MLGVDVAGMSRYEADDDADDRRRVAADRPHLRRRDAAAGQRRGLGRGPACSARASRPGSTTGARCSGAVSEQVRRLDVRASVASPIVVAGRLWGVMIVDSRRDDAAARRDRAAPRELHRARRDRGRQRAHARARCSGSPRSRRRCGAWRPGRARDLARASCSPPSRRRSARVLRADVTRIFRYEPDGTVTVLAVLGRRPRSRSGARLPLDGDNVASRVRDGGRAARIESYADARGPLAEQVHALGAALERGRADRRRGPAVGRGDRGHDARRAAAAGRRGAGRRSSRSCSRPRSPTPRAVPS